MARKKIKFWQRKLIYERDKFSCLICGISPLEIPNNYDGKNTVKCTQNVFLELDHIIPISKGGLDILNNLQTLCNLCNCRKGAKHG